jgi:hypothetical protein
VLTHAPRAHTPHVEGIERRVACIVGRCVVAAVRLVRVQLPPLTHVVQVLPRVALALQKTHHQNTEARQVTTCDAIGAQTNLGLRRR